MDDKDLNVYRLEKINDIVIRAEDFIQSVYNPNDASESGVLKEIWKYMKAIEGFSGGKAG